MAEMVHVEFDWNNEFGLCDECGDLPASYWAPDLIFTRIHLDGTSEEHKGHNLCPICAALWASYGERLERLWEDDAEDEAEAEVPKIRVYKRSPDDPNPHYFSPDRPWMVANIPEDSRETCYPDWEGAMHWATLPSKRRAEIIEIENLMEGGW